MSEITIQRTPTLMDRRHEVKTVYQGNVKTYRLIKESEETNTYILVDEEGNEIPAVLVGEEIVFTATANDIREGTVAATAKGVTVGTKEIPAYHTTEGYHLITIGSDMKIPVPGRYDYTKMQAIVCAFNTLPANSVSAEKVVINDSVYEVGSVEPLASVTVDYDNKAINLGIKNDSGNICVIRYFTYKEE